MVTTKSAVATKSLVAEVEAYIGKVIADINKDLPESEAVTRESFSFSPGVDDPYTSWAQGAGANLSSKFNAQKVSNLNTSSLRELLKCLKKNRFSAKPDVPNTRSEGGNQPDVPNTRSEGGNQPDLLPNPRREGRDQPDLLPNPRGNQPDLLPPLPKSRKSRPSTRQGTAPENTLKRTWSFRQTLTPGGGDDEAASDGPSPTRRGIGWNLRRPTPSPVPSPTVSGDEDIILVETSGQKDQETGSATDDDNCSPESELTIGGVRRRLVELEKKAREADKKARQAEKRAFYSAERLRDIWENMEGLRAEYENFRRETEPAQEKYKSDEAALQASVAGLEEELRGKTDQLADAEKKVQEKTDQLAQALKEVREKTDELAESKKALRAKTDQLADSLKNIQGERAVNHRMSGAYDSFVEAMNEVRNTPQRDKRLSRFQSTSNAGYACWI